MKCIHWLFISIVIYFIFIIGFTLHLPRITLHLPTLPHVIPKFEVSSASLYSLNINSSRISAEWDVTLNVLNPKYWLDVSYKVVSVGVHYNSKHAQDHLGAILLDSFFHGSNDNVTLGVRFNMTVHVDDKVATDIVVSRSRGRVKFGILLSLLMVGSGGVKMGQQSALPLAPVLFGSVLSKHQVSRGCISGRSGSRSGFATGLRLYCRGFVLLFYNALGRYFARQHSHKPVFVVVGMAITKVVVVSVELLLEMSTMSFCVVVQYELFRLKKDEDIETLFSRFQTLLSGDEGFLPLIKLFTRNSLKRSIVRLSEHPGNLQLTIEVLPRGPYLLKLDELRLSEAQANIKSNRSKGSGYKDKKDDRKGCFNCKKLVHFISDCPELLKNKLKNESSKKENFKSKVNKSHMATWEDLHE
ncbi:transmembrane protein, putative [Medicago truncatula]|uniref:Transmembrane protein, putative n=1 Tax=Medicago truncatula TaxID=3880 RepID=A0A072TYV3_MEDTR|nr:transmembrane protein, putative [Medicago truncatula]